MRHYRLAVLTALLLAVFCGVSFAGTVNMTFENVGPGNSIGGEYTYPYYFSINGSSTLTPLICDSYSNSINFGQSWTANVAPLLDAPHTGYWKQAPSLQNYEAAAIIFSEILNGTVVAGQAVSSATGNLAIWALFDGGRSNSGWSTYEQQIINAALGSTGSYSRSFYNQFQVYTPAGGAPGSGPQEFIGFNPNFNLSEPASLPILASGLVMLGGLTRLRV